MRYNVKTNKVETDIKVVINGLKNMREEEERKVANAKATNTNYKKIYGEKECVEFEIEMWKKGIKLNSTLYTKDENGLYKEYSWE